MDWLDEYEQKLDIASPLDMDGDFNGFTLDENETIIAASPQMVAQLIAAVRMVEAELQRYAKFESWSKEKNTDGYSNWMWASNMQIGNDPGVYARNTLAKLQSGEFGNEP